LGKDGMVIADGFMLQQNYPNPFNPATTVRYQLPAPGHVDLRVYDVIGREVAILVNDDRPAGTFAVTWNAGSVSGGTYFGRLTAGGSVQTIRMLLLK
jgi:hypothetical protein